MSIYLGTNKISGQIDLNATVAEEIRVLKEDMSNIYNDMWPIGRGFIDFTNTDYSKWLGFTWERELVGLTPVGYNPSDTDFNTIGKTGGEKTHKITIDEIPSHGHGIPITTNNTGSATIDGSYHYFNDSAFGGYATKTFHIAAMPSSWPTGGGLAHNNMQPYKVVAYWKRVK